MTDRSPVPDAAAAEARARAWTLLAEVLAHGPLPSLLPDLRRSPRLARALDAEPEASADDRAADHHAAFGLEAPPFAGVLLDPDGLAGGPVDAAFADVVARCGVALDPGGEGAGHFAVRFRVLAHLAGAECDAREDDRADEVERLAVLQRTVLDEHVLPALVPWAIAIERLGRPVPSAIAAQALDLALVEREDLGGPVTASTDEPPAAPDLDDPGTGLLEVALHLARPARCGALLTRRDIAAVGRREEVPRGFGDRVRMLENLLHGAAHLDRLDAILEGLERVLGEHAEALAALRSEAPALAPATRPWSARLAVSTDLLGGLRRRAATPAGKVR